MVRMYLNYCHTTITIEFDTSETTREFCDLLQECGEDDIMDGRGDGLYWSSKKVVEKLGLDGELAKEGGGFFSDINAPDNIITIDKTTTEIPQFKLITTVLDKIAKGKYKFFYISDNDYKTLFVTNDKDFVGNYAYHDKAHVYDYVEAHVWNDPELRKQYLKKRKRNIILGLNN